MNRLYNLDYLRGLAAFGIMIYHYAMWGSGNFSADTFLGRLGVYGVSIFYVLSGLTLYYVYYDKMSPSRYDLYLFFKKRIFRIFPLLWLVTFVAIYLSGKSPDLTDLLLNLTGLFGFVKWDTYFSPGIWSIGNELVFYLFFPFFILFTKKYKILMLVLSIILFGLYLYFAFERLPTVEKVAQWRNYINPLNQVFLFLGGFLIGLFFHNKSFNNRFLLSLLIFTLLIFIFYPVSGNQFNIEIGFHRLVFTACCFVICFCFYKLTLPTAKFIHKPLSLLGEASYSVYLLHPIVYELVGRFSMHTFQLSQLVRLIIATILTLVISYLVYLYIEKYFMKLGSSRRLPI